MLGAVCGSTAFGYGIWLWWLPWREQAVKKLCGFLAGTFLMTLLWMGCQSGGCACQEEELLKEALTGIERFSWLDVQSMGPSVIAHRETMWMISVWSLPPPSISWVLRSGNSRSFADIESSKTSLALISLERKNRRQVSASPMLFAISRTMASFPGFLRWESPCSEFLFSNFDWGKNLLIKMLCSLPIYRRDKSC